MKWFMGLGNPGVAYERTRHNVGFQALDRLAGRCGGKWKRSWRFPVWLGTMAGFDRECALVKPRTFMNRSGQAAGVLARSRGWSPEDLVVAYDDVDLPCGTIRLRRKGSAGGHNGVASIIEALGTETFPRLRIGVGPRPSGSDLVDFVLSPFREEERLLMEPALDRVADALEMIVRDGMDAAMNRFNG